MAWCKSLWVLEVVLQKGLKRAGSETARGSAIPRSTGIPTASLTAATLFTVLDGDLDPLIILGTKYLG